MPQRTFILLAAGSSTRMKGCVESKTLAHIAGKPVWAYSYETAVQSGLFTSYSIVLKSSTDRSLIQDYLESNNLPLPAFIQGGATRQDSVWAALSKLDKNSEQCFIHDAARPCISVTTLQSLSKALDQQHSAILATQVKDTIHACAEPASGTIELLDRSHLWAAQTPQAFHTPVIQAAYLKAQESKRTLTDEASALAYNQQTVHFVDNPQPNPKLTCPEDIAWIEQLLQN